MVRTASGIVAAFTCSVLCLYISALHDTNFSNSHLCMMCRFSKPATFYKVDGGLCCEKDDDYDTDDDG